MNIIARAKKIKFHFDPPLKINKQVFFIAGTTIAADIGVIIGVLAALLALYPLYTVMGLLIALVRWAYDKCYLRDRSRDGSRDGLQDGSQDGLQDGSRDGLQDGSRDGLQDGSRDGLQDGSRDGLQDGSRDGLQDGSQDGSRDWSRDGSQEYIQTVSLPLHMPHDTGVQYTSVCLPYKQQGEEPSEKIDEKPGKQLDEQPDTDIPQNHETTVDHKPPVEPQNLNQ